MSGYDNKGDQYEEEIFQICKKKGLIKDNSQRAGAGTGADLKIFKKNNEINLEVKYIHGADWGQKYLDYRDNKGWFWKNPDDVTALYDGINLLSNINPDFRPQNVNHNNFLIKEWNKKRRVIITQKEKDYDLQNFDKSGLHCKNEILFKYYEQKNCYYLQLKNHGLYHLLRDEYNLGTIQFDGEMSIRLRAKPFHAHEYLVDGKKIKSKSKFESLKKNKLGNNFQIIKTPWDYGFQAVLRLSKSPSISNFNLEDEDNIFFKN